MADETAKRDLNRITVLLGIGDDADLEIIQIRVDPTTKRLLVDALTELGGHSTVGDGTQTVTTAGTRVQLSATSVSCKRLIIQAMDNNSGTIVVGGSTCAAAVGSRQGLALYSSQSAVFLVDNLNLLYIDSTESGDKVSYYYEN